MLWPVDIDDVSADGRDIVTVVFQYFRAFPCLLPGILRSSTPTPCRSSGGGCHRAYLVQEGDSFRESASFVPSGPSPVEACLVWCRTWDLALLSTQSVPRGFYRIRRGFLVSARVGRCVLSPSKMRRVTDACSGRIRGPCRGLCFLAPLDAAYGMNGLRAIEWGESFFDRHAPREKIRIPWLLRDEGLGDSPVARRSFTAVV
jgi:hypothetical protein